MPVESTENLMTAEDFRRVILGVVSQEVLPLLKDVLSMHARLAATVVRLELRLAALESQHGHPRVPAPAPALH